LRKPAGAAVMTRQRFLIKAGRSPSTAATSFKVLLDTGVSMRPTPAVVVCTAASYSGIAKFKNQNRGVAEDEEERERAEAGVQV